MAGNKCDMENLRKIKKSEADKYAQENNIRHYQVSAKNGDGIDSVFVDLCEEIYKQKFASEEVVVSLRNKKRGVKINMEEEKKKTDKT